MEHAKQAVRSTPYTVYNGVAAEDIEKDSTVLKIICPELMPNSTYGELGAGITEAPIKLADRDGNIIKGNITTANHIVATWEGASNVRYPPMIRKGEPVELFKVGNQDKFMWRSSGRGRDFRSTDRVVIEVGAIDPTKPGAPKDDTNTYSAYLDSESQKVGIKTSMVNGEAAAFTMEADLKNGTFYVSDNGTDPANRIFLDTGAVSGNPTFQVNLSSGITLKFEGDNAFLKVPGKFGVDAGERIIFNSPLTVFNLEKKGQFIINASSVALNAARDFIVDVDNVFGVSARASKINGVLVTASIRTENIVRAALKGMYKAVRVLRPEETDPTEADNAADTDMNGIPYRN